MKKFLFLLFFTSLCISSCSKEEKSSGASVISEEAASSYVTVTYEQISQQEAKRLIDTEKEYIIVDARTEEEFEEGHIENSILIPEYEIPEKADELLPDKSQLILIYCRSGRRSKIAAQSLADLGYTNVKEFGGIITWEYGTVK